MPTKRQSDEARGAAAATAGRLQQVGRSAAALHPTDDVSGKEK